VAAGAARGRAGADLESKNGTYLAGTRVQEVIVEDQAVITVGKTGLKISMVEEDLGVPEEQVVVRRGDGNSPSMRQLFGFSEKSRRPTRRCCAGETGPVKRFSPSRFTSGRGSAGPAVRGGRLRGGGSDADRERAVGHVRGAFTGRSPIATARFSSRRRQRLLDELGELPLDLQPKLLRVLEGGTVRRVAKTSTAASTCASSPPRHRDLEKEIDAGQFRRDLYYRLAVCWCRCLRCATARRIRCSRTTS